MDIDLSILRMLEREKEISFDVLVEAIEQALLTAYHKTPGRRGAGARRARPQAAATSPSTPRSSTTRAPRSGSTTTPPTGFGRIAATTAKQIMLQRLRDAEDDIRFGEFSGKEGDIDLRGHPAGPQPRRRDGRPRQARGAAAAGRAGARRALRARRADQVPGDLGAQGHARPADHAVALPPQPGQEAVRPRGARDRRRHRRDRRDRPRGRPPHQDRGARRRARASTPRAPASARWASGCAT